MYHRSSVQSQPEPDEAELVPPTPHHSSPSVNAMGCTRKPNPPLGVDKVGVEREVGELGEGADVSQQHVSAAATAARGAPSAATRAKPHQLEQLGVDLLESAGNHSGEP